MDAARVRSQIAVIFALALAAGIIHAQGPCDILQTGGTPCVAAHSTVRALYASYDGPLYQLRRSSDGKLGNVGPLSAGGVADAATQDSFCTATTCTISEIYDQSGKANNLTKSLGGGQVCMHVDQEAVADALPLVLGGHKAYGIKVISDNNGGCTPPAGGEGTGYRLNKTTGIATGDQAETEYMVTSGTTASYQNSGCCFDYGNVETNSEDDGAATMEAIYFGGGAGWGHGGGSGPWVMADMENGIFSGSTSANTGNTSVAYPYVTAVVIGRSGGTYALLGGNAQTGALTTMYDGARPSGYTVMKKQGAIVLGTGGDNSDHGMGYFYEGLMTSGAASTSTMNQVQANIVAAGYGSSSTSILEYPTQRAPAVSLHYDFQDATARIAYTLATPSQVRLRVVDLRGREIARIVDGMVPAGFHQAVWDSHGERAGIYLLSTEIEGRVVWSGNVLVGR
jgi:hypothetical protein